jgi:hypothetical protein
MWVGSDGNPDQYFAGTIHNVSIYKDFAVRLEDAVGWYNNRIYNVEPLMHLPMLAAQNDDGNVRTLDVSGNGYHAAFGDGETSSTYPTKNTKRGYTLDSGDSLRADWPAIGSQTVSVVCGFHSDSYPTTAQYIFDARRTGGTGYMSLNTSYVASVSSGTVYANGKIGTQCGRGYNVVGVTGLTLDVTEGVDIGAHNEYGAANNLVGSMEFFSMYPGTLTQFQMYDIFYRARKQRNYI